MHDYYYRSSDESEEVIIQATGNTKNPLSIRVTEEDGCTTAMVNLPVEEIDHIIAGLQKIKQKLSDDFYRERYYYHRTKSAND